MQYRLIEIVCCAQTICRGPRARKYTIPVEVDNGGPFNSDKAEACYKRNHMRVKALAKYSPDSAIIENSNGWLKRRIAKDVMKRFPNGLARNKRNLRLWKTCVQRSIVKHTRKNEECSKYLRNLIRSVPRRKAAIIASGGGPFA